MSTSVEEVSVSVSIATNPEPRQRQDIQGLRAIAVLLVVAFHGGFGIDAGFAGVDVFFVISGFVIMGQISRLQECGRFSLAGFYARRIQRLLPAMIFMLAVVLLCSLLLQSPLGAQSATGKMAFAASLSLGNLGSLLTTGGYFDAAAEHNPLLHVWSLGVEEQFYLIFPLVLISATLICKRRFTNQYRGLALSVLTILSFALAVTLSFSSASLHGHAVRDLAFYMAPARAWEFGAGALLFLWSLYRPTPQLPRYTRLCTTLGIAGLAILILMNIVLTRDTVWPGIATVVPVLAAILLIQAGTLPSNVVSRLLAMRPLVHVGDMSYSIYLWHWPVIFFTALLTDSAHSRQIAAIASLAPAWAAYRFVEQPLRLAKLSRRKIFVGAGALVSILAMTAAALPFAGASLTPKAEQYRSDRTTLTYGRATGCMLLTKSFQASDINRCTTHVANSRGLIMLVGDSHADALSNGVISAANHLGYDTLVLTGGGCEFSRTAPPNSFVPNCPAMQATLLDQAERTPPALLIMSHWL